MSFEGYYSLICVNGHQWSVDVYESDPASCVCPTCQERPEWEALVNTTNGVDYEDPSTVDPKVKVIREWFETVTMQVRRAVVEPDDPSWRKVSETPMELFNEVLE